MPIWFLVCWKFSPKRTFTRVGLVLTVHSTADQVWLYLGIYSNFLCWDCRVWTCVRIWQSKHNRQCGSTADIGNAANAHYTVHGCTKSAHSTVGIYSNILCPYCGVWTFVRIWQSKYNKQYGSTADVGNTANARCTVHCCTKVRTVRLVRSDCTWKLAPAFLAFVKKLMKGQGSNASD